MKLTTFFEPVSNLSKKQKIRSIFFIVLFSDIITRILKIDSILVKNIIDSVMVLCLIGFIFELLYLKKKRK
ncbi:hypothetical protein [Neobacillus drentensis]|uniref:hypothetical protein n=1 Tax=Neobacillus drentensis TaxID=220684 RepID=UPI003000372B